MRAVTRLKTSPANASGDAGRVRGFRLLTNTVEDSRSPLPLQLAFLSRRVGMVDPAALATLAVLAFGERPA